MFCVHCGKSLPDDAVFCPFCGKSTAVTVRPSPTPSPTQEPPAPTSPIEPSTSSPAQDSPAPEPNVIPEPKLPPAQETPAPTSDKAKAYRVTFMRWDTSGPDLTITFPQGDPFILTSSASHTVMLHGGTQRITLDTASQHSEFEISLEADSKVNLRWDSSTNLFSADCGAREESKFATSPQSTPDSDKTFSWSYKRSFFGSLRRKISYTANLRDNSLSLVQNDRFPFGYKTLERKNSVALADIKEIIFQSKASVYFWLISGFLLAFLPAAAILYAVAVIAPPNIVFGFGIVAFLQGIFNLFFYRFHLHHYRLTFVDSNGKRTRIEAQSSGELERLSFAVSQQTGISYQKSGSPVLTILISACVGIAIAVGGLLLLFPSHGNQVSGVWKLDHMTVDGTTWTASELGNDSYIYLSENSLAEVTVDYGSVERELGTWELIDSKTLLLTLTSTGEEMRFSRSRNILSCLYDGVTMYFTRSTLSPSQIPKPTSTPLPATDSDWSLPSSDIASAEYPYYLASDMDDILNVDLWGEVAFLDAVDEGWGWDWLSTYTGFGSADVDSVPEPLWFNESLGEWTIYGVTYDRACTLGWGDAWIQLMYE